MDRRRRLLAQSIPAIPAGAAAIWLSGCEPPASEQSPLAEPVANFLSKDLAWYRDQFIAGNAEPRRKVAVAPNGFYAPNLSRDWRLQGEQRGTLITQTRAIYVMAAGYEVSGEPAYRDALLRTADFLLTKWRHPREPGFWVKEVAPDGKVLNDDVHFYGQMHAIFALAHAYRSTQEKRFLDAALNTWLNLDIRALVAGKRPGYSLTGLNIAMHAFEAILALHRAAPSRVLFDDLGLLGERILKHFMNEKEGYFYESLTEDLKPMPGGEINMGHNFQMAFLFSRAVASGLPEKFLDAAVRVAEFAAIQGVNGARGSVALEYNYKGAIRNPALAHWPHTEALRCLAHFAIQRQRPGLKPQFDSVLAFAKAHFIDSKFGGWYRVADQSEQGKGADWFAGYHEAMMSTEILRLAGATFTSGNEMLL